MVVPEDIWNAAFEGHVAPVQAWLDSGGDPSDVDETGFTLIYRALQQQVMTPGRSAVVRLVVARGADICQVSANFPLSPLHQAMLEWNEASIDLLLELGADATVNPNGPLEYAFYSYGTDMPTKLGFIPRDGIFQYFNVAVLAKLLRAGASLDFSAAGHLRYLIEDGRPGAFALEWREEHEINSDHEVESDFEELDVDERVREITAGIDLLAGVREDGSYRNYLRRPHKALLRIRSLRARGRANAVDATPPHVAHLLDPAFPNEIAWNVLTYYRDAG